MPLRTRAASDPRSTGTRTGPHGACLTAAVWRSGNSTRQSKARETRFWSRAIGVEAGGECRKRERRKAACPLPDPLLQEAEDRRDKGAQPRFARTLVGQCAFRRSASLFRVRDLVRKPDAAVRDRAREAQRIFVVVIRQSSDADDAPRERVCIFTSPRVRERSSERNKRG